MHWAAACSLIRLICASKNRRKTYKKWNRVEKKKLSFNDLSCYSYTDIVCAAIEFRAIFMMSNVSFIATLYTISSIYIIRVQLRKKRSKSLKFWKWFLFLQRKRNMTKITLGDDRRAECSEKGEEKHSILHWKVFLSCHKGFLSLSASFTRSFEHLNFPVKLQFIEIWCDMHSACILSGIQWWSVSKRESENGRVTWTFYNMQRAIEKWNCYLFCWH